MTDSRIARIQVVLSRPEWFQDQDDFQSSLAGRNTRGIRCSCALGVMVFKSSDSVANTLMAGPLNNAVRASLAERAE